MKNLTNKENNFLKQLATEIANQDNRATQNIGFMVEEDYKDYQQHWSFKERVEDFDIDDICDSCSTHYHLYDNIPALCNECDDDCFTYYNKTSRLNHKAWVFLTNKACNEHIANNSHHYNNPRSFWVHFWRNQEMINLVNIIFKLWWIEKPSHWDAFL